MKTKAFLCVFLAILAVQGCGKKTAEFNSDFSLFREYITGFTGGTVSAGTDIRVVFAFEKKQWKINQVLDGDLLDISPSVDGKIVALSPNTIAFIPEKKLKQDTEYRITLKLSQIVQVPEELADFHFSIKTIRQDFMVEPQDIQSYSSDFHYLNATLRLADEIDRETASKLISAEHNGKPLKIKFDRSQKTGTDFKFIIDSIKSGAFATDVKISYDGDALGIDQQGKLNYAVAAKGDFKVVKVTVPEGESKSVLINFSQPLQRGQDFSGLVSIQNAFNLKFSTQGNLLRVYFDNENPHPQAQTVTDTAATVYDDYYQEHYSNPDEGFVLLEVFQGIQSEYGAKLRKGYSEKLTFDQPKPGVSLLKSGTILPSSNNLKVNFEAVSLKAVDIKVYKIYQNTILQFLQDNTLSGSQNLKQVAQPIAKTRLDLQQNRLTNLRRPNTFALDLSKIVTPEPGAVYRVEFSYKKAYSVYKCEGVTADDPVSDQDEPAESDVNYSDYYEDYYYDDYNWRERQDPCSNSYYYNTRLAANVLATDLGVIVKRGGDKSVFVAVNNIVSTAPVPGATVTLYSYQQQKLASGKTNAEGTLNLPLDKFAYFAIVTKGKETTYVKLDDGISLSVSNFDVSGETLQKGLKGFIYGERGVWRPGDKLHLAFILNDAANKLPKAHPIKFRLTDPSGKIVYQTVKRSDETNHYVFSVPTNTDAPTGNWEAQVSVGGAKFYKSVKIETIKPNRLRIKTTFGSALLSAGYPNRANLEVAWLHGAVARNLKVEMQAKFSQQVTAFKNYPKYNFDDLVRRFSTEEITIFSGKTDDNGRASVAITPKLQGQAPGMVKAAFITKVYEEGGDFSTDVVSASYSPYKTYVGIKPPQANKYGMLETRVSNQFDIVTVDESGRPKAVRDLEVKVFKVEWRWWWDASEDNLSNYNASNATTAFKTFRVNTDTSGKASVKFAVTDQQWGRYLIRVSDPAGGHAAAQTVLIDWPSWSGKARNTEGSSPNMLVFSTDKKQYGPGEKALVSFPSSEGGRALISIENGTKVLQTIWAETKRGETLVEIPVTPQMAPNVYFHITLLQPHASTLNDSPIRMYGVVPIEVVDKNTVLHPKIVLPDVLKPERPFQVKVSENSGKAMTYTIAIVDEGLLDLTRFKTPNAWNAFYVREALGVKTWDVYDDVIGAYGGKVNQVFSIGGDQDLGGAKAKKANRFKPVVMYLGPFRLEKGASKTHQLTLPQYIGSVRTMVVAGDAASGAYGSVEKATPVRSPLMVLASVPRKISPSEQVTVPVTVFSMQKNISNVKVQLKAGDGLRIIGSASQNVTFTQPDEKLVYFNLAVGSATGIGKVQVTATSGNEKAVYDVEIDMTNPNPVINTFTDALLEAGSTKTISWKTFGTSGSNRARLEVSSIPTIDINRRLQYLITYPHGCVEQTTSSVFPQLFLNDMADLDPSRRQNIQKNVTAGISRLGSFQLANGGFPYWQGNPAADDWGTSYAGHFLVEAEKKGYVLPINCKSKWIAYQQKEARQWRFAARYGNDLAQAYRLYTLALAGAPDLSSMNRLRETAGVSNECRLRLAAAYALAGQKAAAGALLAKTVIEEQAQTPYNYYYYGSAARNRAMTLETLLLLGQKQRAFETAIKLAREMSADSWMSTQTTAYSLYAMSKFALANGSKGIDVSYTKDAKTLAVKTTKAFADRQLTVRPGSNGITIRNNKNNTLYVRVLNSGILPIGQEQVLARGLSAKVVFKNRKGDVMHVGKIAQATEFVAEITVANQRNEHVENIALSQILPSGFEIVNTRFTDFGDAVQNTADYIDIRDDRTNFYFPLKANESKTFRVLLNASYLGTYYLPGIQCEAMYDHSFVARTKGQWIQVVQ